MTSKLVVNTIEADTGISSVSFASSISMSSTSKFHFSAAGVDIGADTNINRPASGVLGFNINSSEKARIDSSGRLLLGTTTEGQANADNLTIEDSGSAGITIRAGNTSNSSVYFSDGTSGASEYVGAVEYNHSNNELRFYSNSIQRAKFNSSGHFHPHTDSAVDLGLTGTRFRNVYADTLYGDGSNLTGITGTTINGNTDHYVVTATGTANTLQGESTLTYDGNQLNVIQTTSSSDSKVVIANSNTPGSGGLRLEFQYGTGTVEGTNRYRFGYVEGYRAGGSNDGGLKFGTKPSNAAAPTERLRIDPSGRVLIGTTTEGSGGADELTIATTGDTGMTIRSGTSSAGGIYFSDGTSGGDEYRGVVSYNHASNFMRFYTDGTEKVRISSSGQLQISPAGAVKMSFYHDSGGSLNHITSNNGNEIKVSSGNGSTNGIEFWDYTGTDKRCQIDGQGIKFNNDTAQANGLNDYEEGSWTPSIISGASGISVSTATYTKVGRLVHVQCRYNSLSSPNGSQLKIGGLPYSAASVGHYTTAVMHDGWDFAGSQEPVPTVYQSANNPHFVFYYSRTAGQGWAAVSGSDTNGQGAIFSWCYHSA